MDRTLFLLVILLANPIPSFAEPSGKLGCRFSPVCDEDELCAEDKLFGTCMRRSEDYLPSYDLDPAGLKRLKNVVQYLLDQGFAWEDQYAQDSLQEILDPFKQNIVSVNPNLRPPQVPSPADEEEEEAWANVEELSAAYQAIVDEYQERYNAYAQLVNEYGFGNDAELTEYAQEMRQNYDQLIRDLQVEERTNLRKLYNLYYDKYLALRKAEQEAGSNMGLKMNGEPGDMYQEGGNWKGLYKLQLLKEYLQLLYNENRDRWVVSSSPPLEDGGLDYSSLSGYTLGSFVEEWNGDFGDELLGETENDDGDGDDDGDAVAMETMPAAPQDEDNEIEGVIWNMLQDGENREAWDELTDEEKEELINELLDSEDAADVSQEALMGDEEDAKVKKDREEEELPEEDAGKETEGEDAAEEPIEEDESGGQSKGQGVGKPGEEFVEPLKQPKESGLNLDVGLAKKDEDAVAMVTPASSAGSDEAAAAPTPSPTSGKHSTFAPSGYVFIALQSGISLQKAERLVEELAIELEAPEGSFTDIDTGERQVTFKVNPDIIRMTPAEVAGAAAAHQTDLEVLMDVTITETGVGKQTHITVLDAPQDDNSTLIIVTVVLVACIVGVLIAVITVYCYRQKARIRAKLKGLASNGGAVEGEATADYQDLCRQRMASKSSEKPEPLSRISSVAMSEGAAPSPSSRSSTSSWSEEPVQSNMDISTGHIVLSYMEDHLRNKDRLTKEWDALCRYEPDISSTKVGALTVNTPRNRYQDVLPYDHTRVLLNDSTNALSSDYINASTIADADPRSPAYIATQAPLPSTVSDFWQMVWEQGVVVIVNLTPMTDTDTVHTLYWPPEGGTAYHFYEVHLVSEHVWCDDYLVRSFYLKNTETQETRTVTQFHFLTWPENGIPPSPKALLEFRRKVNKSYRGKACPIVVHCSDGVGRTGTYCLVDMVLTRMTKGAKEIDIAATLEHIRDQRPGAVKLKAQFEFALTALAEEVNAILKALPQ